MAPSVQRPESGYVDWSELVAPDTMTTAPLAIALLTYATKPRGSVMHTLELAQALHDLGHRVTVYALDKDGRGFDRPSAFQTVLIPAAPAPPDMAQVIAQRIQEFVTFLQVNRTDQLKHDLYHAQDCISANALLELRDRGWIPHFLRTVHHIDDFPDPYLQDCQDRSIRQPDQCFCVSQHWQRVLAQDYGIDAPQVINGIDTQRFSAQLTGDETELKQRWGLTGSPIFLTVGGIEPRKNSLRLLQAFAQVRQTYPTAQLVIAGGATVFDYQAYRDQFLAQAQALQLTIDTELILPGVIPATDLPGLYRCADAFVFPSVKEGWGLVLLEAIASGLPIITANQSPFTEFLTPAQACLVDPCDVNAIAIAMCRSIDPQIATTLIAASQAVLSHYTWPRSAQQHLTVYQQLLATHQGAPKPPNAV